MSLRRRLTVVPIAVLASGLMAGTANADSNLGTVGGLTYINDSTPESTPPEVLRADAACPGDTHVVGGGVTPASQTNVAAEFWINRSSPYDGPDQDKMPDDGWFGRANNRFGHDKVMGVFAICQTGPVRYPTNTVRLAPGGGAVAKATCPGGTHVTNGGAAISGPGSEAYLNSSAPFDSGKDTDRLVDDGWTARAFNAKGTAKQLSVYATCVSNRPIYTAQSASGPDPIFFNTCDPGTHAMGGGMSISGPASGGFLNALYPFAEETNPPDAGFVSLIYTRGVVREATGFVICKT
jgi:hypothetical protein